MIIVFENFFLVKLSACLMDPETAVTWTCGHFNQVIFAVYTVITSRMNSLNLTIILGEGGVDHVKGGLQQFECTSCISLLPWIQVDEQNRNLSQFRQPTDFMTMVKLHQKEKNSGQFNSIESRPH